MDENIGRPKTFYTSSGKTDLEFCSFLVPNIYLREHFYLILDKHEHFKI